MRKSSRCVGVKKKQRGCRGNSLNDKSPAIKISDYVQRNAHFLARVAHCRSAKRYQRLLSVAGPEQLLCLVECCLNLLAGRSRIRQKLFERLQPYADQIRQLSRVRSVKKARQHLQEGGGQAGRGLPLFIPLVVSTLLPLIVERAATKVFSVIGRDSNRSDGA